MTPGDFLRAVWPGEGTYCLATPFVIPGSNPPRKAYAHKTFSDISEAVSFVLKERGSKDLYFAIHTLKQASVWNADKINAKTGEPGANETRVQRNMKAARAFFFDLDVGESVDKYSDQDQALFGLREFCKVTKLPRPLIVSSGGGLHVYWMVSETLDSELWKDEAAKLRQLARHHGLKIDLSRTTDTTSLLRVADTYNWKNRSKPRKVEVMLEGATTGTGAFIKMVDTALIEAGVEIKPLPKFDAASQLGSNLEREFDGPPVSLKAVVTACKQMQRLMMAGGDVSEPEWYHGIIGIGRFLEDGHRRVHQMSQGYPGYNEADTTIKIRQHESRRDATTGKALGPTSCAKLVEVSRVGDVLCEGCPHAGLVHGPIGAGRKIDSAPAPVVMELVGTTPIATTIPPAPKPFTRMKGGGISVAAKNADGDEAVHTIYDYDLFPVRRLSNTSHGIEQQVWHVDLPRTEAKDFTLDADMLYDARKFVVAISNQGIYPNKGHIAHLQEYMVAYIAQLQKLVDADAQCNHLGWSDDYNQFIFPDKILLSDGTARAAQLSLGAQRASMQVHRKGDAAEQVRLLNFYNHHAYRPQQFYILAGLGAPLFHATGHHGVIVNASGDAGASKSTSLYTAASFWGQPELYPINGTNNGATVRGRNERVTVLANLPVCVDEITHMPIKDSIDLAMSITQPGHRIRLQTDGVERASLGSYKATIMLTTANNSLHGMLSMDNAAGTAGSMRVFEIRFERHHVHKKHEADDFMFKLKQNFGHLGEPFVAHVLKNKDAVIQRVRAKMQQIDIEANIQPSERFWSATVAVVLVTAEIARELGILSWDVEAIKAWVLNEQIPYMRGVVKEEYSDPLAIVADYLETINHNMLVMERVRSAGGNLGSMSRRPTGALLAHYDTDDKMLYVLKKGFKDYCARIGANSLKVIDDLVPPRDGVRIIANKHVRRTLGAGTEYAKAQSWCFVVNMAHPEVSGAIDLEVLIGGGQGDGQDRSERPGLHVVH